jgi:hypothetical protein
MRRCVSQIVGWELGLRGTWLCTEAGSLKSGIERAKGWDDKGRSEVESVLDENRDTVIGDPGEWR